MDEKRKGMFVETRKEINKQTRKFAFAYVYSSLRINAIIATHVYLYRYLRGYWRHSIIQEIRIS